MAVVGPRAWVIIKYGRSESMWVIDQSPIEETISEGHFEKLDGEVAKFGCFDAVGLSIMKMWIQESAAYSRSGNRSSMSSLLREVGLLSISKYIRDILAKS